MRRLAATALLLAAASGSLHPSPAEEPAMSSSDLRLASPAFGHRETIPTRYTCQGRDLSPPLAIDGIPPGTESLVLLVEDPDAPDPKAPKTVWDHWVVFDILPDVGEIAEGEVPAGARQGRNGWGRNDWGGPCPPIGEHRYVFRLFALDAKLGLAAGATKAQVERAMEGHVLARAELIGLYEKR